MLLVKMRNLTYFFLFFCCLTIGQDNEHAWVYFNDKPNFETYLDNPNLILSEKSIQKKNNKNVSIDYLDVPVYKKFIDSIDVWGKDNVNTISFEEFKNLNSSLNSDTSNTIFSETSNNVRFTRFNNPLISYDYKCGHYLNFFQKFFKIFNFNISFKKRRSNFI